MRPGGVTIDSFVVVVVVVAAADGIKNESSDDITIVVDVCVVDNVAHCRVGNGSRAREQVGC